jgi:hypothetical protein
MIDMTSLFYVHFMHIVQRMYNNNDDLNRDEWSDAVRQARLEQASPGNIHHHQ